MVKQGDKLVCRKYCTFYSPWAISFFENQTYSIFEVKGDVITVLSQKNDFQDFSFTKKRYREYIWDYFYTQAEWREKQIDSILAEQEIDGGNILND